jgi:ABC-2 type transport system permease protein
MRKLWEVAINDLRVFFAESGVWISVVIIPVVLIFFIGLANGGFGSSGPAAINVDLYDNDNSELSARFVEDLRAVNKTLRLCPIDDGEGDPCAVGENELTPETSIERVRSGATSAIITIPAGFGESALNGQPVNIGYQSQETIGQPSAVLQAVQAAVQRVGGASVAARVSVDVFENSGVEFEFADEADRENFQQAVYDRASTIWSGLPESVDFRLSAQEGSTNSGFAQSVPGIGTMYVMGNVMVGAILLLTERKQWTLQRLISMPVSAQQVIGGKMLARFIIGMVQYAIAFGFGLLLGVRYGQSPLAILAIMVAFTLCSTALTLLLATFIKTEQQGAVILNLAILVLAPLGGAWWPLEIVPEWMRIVGHISPIAWAMDGFRSVIFNGGGLAEVALPVGVLLGATVVLFFLAVRRFKYE